MDIDRNGSLTIDPSTKELLISRLGNQTATLGRYFLTSAYLMINHEVHTFTLWQANPSDQSSLVSVLTPSAGSTSDGAGRGSNHDDSSSNPTPESSHSNTGAIVGGVIGGLGFLAALVAAYFFIRKQRQVKQNEPVNASPPEDIHELKSGGSMVDTRLQTLGPVLELPTPIDERRQDQTGYAHVAGYSAVLPGQCYVYERGPEGR